MAEPKKEAYRAYLESAGVIESLTKVLVSLFEEPDKPVNAVEYLKAQLGGPTRSEHEALKTENEELRTLVEQLRQLVPEQPPAQEEATADELKEEVEAS
ncbi:hypothetical protein WJX74_008581 [Apatococcus lobatus]|uniref:c-Myc-binding protein n=2 Tax=Apatococcus TaxID=904362 RepID=A0AAW1T6Z3_9CHLO